MQDKDTTSNITALENVINIDDFGSRRKEQIEKWLTGRIIETYGDRDDVIVKNPLIRLSTIFEALSDTARYELYGYAKRAAYREHGRPSMAKEFWGFLEMAPAAWGDIEKFADTLLVKDGTYSQMNGGLV